MGPPSVTADLPEHKRTDLNVQVEVAADDTHCCRKWHNMPVETHSLVELEDGAKEYY